MCKKKKSYYKRKFKFPFIGFKKGSNPLSIEPVKYKRLYAI